MESNNSNTAYNMSEYQASAEQLLASANDSTKHVRTVYLTFLLLLTYTGVIIGSTTDEQLLLVDQVTLPLLNVGLPILQFYILAPWLVILFHFNLLLQFSLTARCLHELNSAIERIDNLEGSDIFRARLFPFHFSHLLAGHHPSVSIRLLLMVIVWTTVILLPLALLLWAQIRFLPYHDTSITWAHRLTLLTDLVLLWVLWPMIVMPESNVSAWWRGLITGGMRRARLLFNYLVMFIRAPRKNGKLKKRDTPASPINRARGGFILVLTTLMVIPFSFFVIVIPNEPIEVWTARKIAESWLSKKVNYEGEHYFNLTWLLFDKDGALFHRNLQLSELILVTGKVNAEIIASLDDTDPDQRRAALNRLLGVNLAGRDLRLANFYQAKLPKADLRNADMRGARLEEANLQEARLDNADLRWTNFSYARLQNTNLVQANLQNAKMFRTNLQNANLEKAALQYASLPNAMLLGSNLKYAHMQHAQLTGAVMLNANLAGAQLQGANLDNAYLQKAYLAKANLMMSNLENTQLQLAYLHSAQLQGVNLLRTGLQGANLAFADFSGADFTDTKVSGAIFNQTRLKLSNLAFIHRAPLTIKEYESYINKLNMKINNKSWLKGFSNEYLKIVDKPYSINFGALTEKAFCVSEQVKLGCVSYGQPATGRTIDQYDIDLSSYLLELACIDEYLVDALSNRAIEMADKFRNRMLGPLLATGLLNPHCSKAQNLSNDKREILEQRAKNLERLMN